MIDGKDFLDQPIKNDLKKHLTIFKKFQQVKEMSTQLVVYQIIPISKNTTN